MYTHGSFLIPKGSKEVPSDFDLKSLLQNKYGQTDQDPGQQVSTVKDKPKVDTRKKLKQFLSNSKKCTNCQDSEAKICLKSICGISIDLVSLIICDFSKILQ